MNRRELVLATLACAGGRAFTPVQIQKALFLISRNVPHLVDEGPCFQFEPYDYGPFDNEVYREAEALQAGGLATISPSPRGRWSEYAATDQGVTEGTVLLERLRPDVREYLQQVSGWVRSQSFSQLVRSIYQAYPEMRQNSIFRG